MFTKRLYWEEKFIFQLQRIKLLKLLFSFFGYDYETTYTEERNPPLDSSQPQAWNKADSSASKQRFPPHENHKKN